MNPGGRLLIIEMVLPDGDTLHPGKILGMAMLVAPTVPKPVSRSPWTTPD
jgi:hypothetical protein